MMSNPYEPRKRPKIDRDDILERTEEQEESLQRILKKLRPFQREAYDFATNGKIYTRQCNAKDSDHKTSSFEYDPSLLGKGRILLCDEMGKYQDRVT